MTDDRSLGERFEEFHLENLHVYNEFRSWAFQWVYTTGRHKLGTKALFERVRWEVRISTGDPDYKLNNNYTSCYARLLMLMEPKLDGVFELRVSQADEWIESQASPAMGAWIDAYQLYRGRYLF